MGGERRNRERTGPPRQPLWRRGSVRQAESADAASAHVRQK